ncbi:MAG: SDR family NAD(P)-dependent oxidoreductase [Acidimicrobiales bacterium]
MKSDQRHVAVVTGAGTGIGRAVARRIVLEGGDVVLTGRRHEPLQEIEADLADAPGRVLVRPGDHADEQHVERMFAAVESAFGPVTLLVNNAAIAGAVDSIWDLDAGAFTEALHCNVVGPWLCCRAAARSMRETGAGSIVSIGSISGKRPLVSRTPYTTSKMALVGLTRTLAAELGPSNITVNLVSPGPVDTPRLAELAEKWNRPLDELVAEIAGQSALGRVSTADDIADAVMFLASRGARNITGVDLTVDGGIWMQ